MELVPGRGQEAYVHIHSTPDGPDDPWKQVAEKLDSLEGGHVWRDSEGRTWRVVECFETEKNRHTLEGEKPDHSAASDYLVELAAS